MNKIKEYQKIKGFIPITAINSKFVIQRDLYTDNKCLEIMEISGKYAYHPITLFEDVRMECKLIGANYEFVLIFSINKNRCRSDTMMVEMIDVFMLIHGLQGMEIDYYKGH